MSTEFLANTTDELAFVRFCGNAKAPVPAERTCFEFGTLTNFLNVLRATHDGETFRPIGESLDHDPVSVDDLFRLLAADRITFGRFPITVEVGSGDLFRFTQEG